MLSRALPTPSIESPGLEIRTGSDAGESAVTFEVVIKNGATTPEPLNLRARIKSLIREAIRESRPILLAWKFTDAKGAQNTGDSSVQFDYNGGSFKGFGEALTNSQAFEGIVMSPTGEELYASDEYKSMWRHLLTSTLHSCAYHFLNKRVPSRPSCGKTS